MAAEVPGTPKRTRPRRLVLSPLRLPRRHEVDRGFQLEGRTTEEFVVPPGLASQPKMTQ